MRNLSSTLFRQLQTDITETIEQIDGGSRFQEDEWAREGGGGGLSRVLKNGRIFEQAGVNFSRVTGVLPIELSHQLTGESIPQEFFATGVSLVIHPYSPRIPTTHANYRYLEVGRFRWFGGGGDLTPFVLNTEDATHFHRTLKSICDRHDPNYYTRFKTECDRYFYLPHRGETRGIGGVFFDSLGKGCGEAELSAIFDFVKDMGEHFPASYLPIVEAHSEETFTDQEKQFQLLRRGRYVEFNLVYDRGTLFGLKTGGRTESILMSLPPNTRWEYFRSPEAEREGLTEGQRNLLDVLRSPQEWV